MAFVRQLAVLLVLVAGSNAWAQDSEPRRWTHLPTGLNVLGIGLGHEAGDIALDPVLEIEDGEYTLAITSLVYMRTFGLFGKSARIDVLTPYAGGRWEGLLEGEPASTRRRGFTDPRIRFSMLLYGAPAESRAEFAVSEKSNTVVGAALAVTLPVGDYLPDRLINLGGNRWVFRPQLGVTHARGPWTYELTASVYVYGDNDDFRSGNSLETDPLWAGQAHVIYSFRPGVWASVSTAYGDGAEVSINGVQGAARTENWLTSLAAGFPVNRQQSVKLAWVRGRTQYEIGRDFDTVIASWTFMY